MVTGGLNYQIEHHLFPQISHVHYPKLSLIVKQVCQEYNIPYIEYPKVSEAIASPLFTFEVFREELLIKYKINKTVLELNFNYS